MKLYKIITKTISNQNVSNNEINNECKGQEEKEISGVQKSKNLSIDYEEKEITISLKNQNQPNSNQNVDNDSNQYGVSDSANNQDEINSNSANSNNQKGSKEDNKNIENKENVNEKNNTNEENNAKEENENNKNAKDSVIKRIKNFFKHNDKTITPDDDYEKDKNLDASNLNQEKSNNEDKDDNLNNLDLDQDASSDIDTQSNNMENHQDKKQEKEISGVKKCKNLSLDYEEKQIKQIVISNLISKFLKQQFKSKNSSLNHRSTSLEKTDGYLKWDIKKIVEHMSTSQYTKIPFDKYGYDYDKGKNETIPLSFYFDLSPSMTSNSSLLATMAYKLLQNNVKVLIGSNQWLQYQICEIDSKTKYEDIISFLHKTNNGFMGWGFEDRLEHKKVGVDAITKEDIYFYKGIKYKSIKGDFDEYLIERKAEKCVVFADDDPAINIINLSAKADVYWFHFRNRKSYYNYQGILLNVKTETDILKALKLITENGFKKIKNQANGKSIDFDSSWDDSYIFYK